MRKSALAVAALAAAAVASPAWAGPTIKVDDDRADCKDAEYTSIQAAVTAAPAGARILVCAGTYVEKVTLKSNLTLQAQGAPGSVVLQGPPNLYTAFVLERVSNVELVGFTIRDYPGPGILLKSASGNRIRQNVISGNGESGIRLEASSKNLLEHNNTFDNGQSGLTLVSGSAKNVVQLNDTYGNRRAGIRLRRAGSANVLFNNDSEDNGRQGILNQSTNGTVIRNNRSYDNRHSGIAILHSTNVLVELNHAFGNRPDLYWDRFGTNTWTNNHCNSSVPRGLGVQSDSEHH